MKEHTLDCDTVLGLSIGERDGDLDGDLERSPEISLGSLECARGGGMRAAMAEDGLPGVVKPGITAPGIKGTEDEGPLRVIVGWVGGAAVVAVVVGAGAGAILFFPLKVRHIELSEEPLPRRLRSFVRGGLAPSV